MVAQASLAPFPVGPVGRNAPCPCGSGEKYKGCCLRQPAPAVPAALPALDTFLCQVRACARRLPAGDDQDHAMEALARAALDDSTTRAYALHLMGKIRAERGDHTAAETLYLQAIRTNPQVPEFHNDLGVSLRVLGRSAEAVLAYLFAVQRAPGFLEARTNLASTLARRGPASYALALEQFRTVLQRAPSYPPALVGLLTLVQQVCAWADVETAWRALQQAPAATPHGLIPPLSLLSLTDSPQQQRACAQAWSMAHLTPWIQCQGQIRRGAAWQRRERPARLRVGYLSGDFRQHATGILMAELLELHDRARWEVTCYSLRPEESPMARRLQAACATWVDAYGLSPAVTAQRIADDAIDILLDVNGHGETGRLEVLALRPAPVQAHFLAYPGTLAAPGVAYLISDPLVTPLGAETHFAERLVVLPDCYQPNDRQRAIATRLPTRAACGLPATGFVWCCFCGSAKLRPDVFSVWMRLLRATPGSVLWMLGDGDVVRANLRREAAARGLSPDRLVFAPKVAHPEHLARYRVADLCLDTFPYGGHTTSSDALWAGTPLVTCTGQSYASRVAGSLLHAVGLPELVTHALGDYETLALRLAQHPRELAALRERLAAGRDTCPLFDTPRYVRNLEAAYEQMWREGPRETWPPGWGPLTIQTPAAA